MPKSEDPVCGTLRWAPKERVYSYPIVGQWGFIKKQKKYKAAGGFKQTIPEKEKKKGKTGSIHWNPPLPQAVRVKIPKHSREVAPEGPEASGLQRRLEVLAPGVLETTAT